MATIVTDNVQDLIAEAGVIAALLDGKPTDELVEYNGHHHTPAMLLALAYNRLSHAADELDASRMTCFGFDELPPARSH